MTRIMCFLALIASLVSIGAHAQRDYFQPEIAPALVSQYVEAKRLRESGHFSESADKLQDVVKASPEYFNALYLLGVVLTEEKKFKDSIPYLEKAAAIKTKTPRIDDAHIYNSLGWAYMMNGDFKKAESTFQEAEKNVNQLNKEVKGRLYNNMGYLYLLTGKLDQSERYLTIALEKYDNKKAKINLNILQDAR